MSQHIVEDDNVKFVFGWDQPLMTFYLQKHDKTRSEDEQIIFWLGTRPGEIYEVEQLVRVGYINGLDIPYETRVKLYGEKDDGL